MSYGQPGQYPGAGAPYPGYPPGAAPGQPPYPGQPQGQPAYSYPVGQQAYPPSGYPPQGAAYPTPYPAAGYPPQGAPGYPPAFQQPGYPLGAPVAAYPPQGAFPGAPIAYAVPMQAYQPGMGVPPPHMGAGMVTVTYAPDEPTLRPKVPFDAEYDCKALHKAMKGLGTDEKAIIDILTNRALAQRLQLTVVYKTMFGKDLISHLKSELSGNLENTVVALLQPAEIYDAHSLHDAICRVGTVESTLIEIIFSRTNAEMHAIKTAYKFLFRENLEEAIKSDTSGYFRRVLVACLTGARQEGYQVDLAKAQHDAKALYDAGAKRWGTDESAFISIFALRSLAHLKVVFDEYKRIANKDIESSIKSEMSGSAEDSFLAIARIVKNRHAFFAERLHDSMACAGTKDNQLIRVVVTRCEKDLGSIKREYLRMYGKTVESFISSDCSGDYKKVLLAIVNYGSR